MIGALPVPQECVTKKFENILKHHEDERRARKDKYRLRPPRAAFCSDLFKNKECFGKTQNILI